MMSLSLILLALGLFRAGFKGYAVWGLAHDVHDHGPVPKLDFILFCPLPIAFGTSLVLRAQGSLLFPWVGPGIYFALSAAFGGLHAYFDRTGKPERQRQLAAILKQRATTQGPTASPVTEATPKQEPRERLFFWLGVFVLPIFWSWFTLGRSFTSNQRVVAFAWLAMTLCWVVYRWQALAEHWALMSIGYPIVLGWVTLSLLAWLLFRLGVRPSSLIELLFMVWFMGAHLMHLMDPFYFAVGKPFSVFWFLPPLLLAVLHLMLEPVKRWAWGSRSLRDCTDSQAVS